MHLYDIMTTVKSSALLIKKSLRFRPHISNPFEEYVVPDIEHSCQPC